MPDTPSFLNMFYGKECPHCAKMLRLAKRLEVEENVTIMRFEIWHDAENMKTMEAIDRGKCDGVPFFYNEKTRATLCGEATYEELKQWAGTK